MNTDQKIDSKFSRIAIQILHVIVVIWMIFIVSLYLFLYTPPQIMSGLAKIGIDKPLVELREQVMGFFQTADFSDYIKNYY
jgi:hypothetical protein